MTHRDELFAKILILNETIWEDRVKDPLIREWIANFNDPVVGDKADQELHALYLLSQFMYFGGRQMREMLKVLFRDLYKYPIIEEIRHQNADTTDVSFITQSFESALERTMFLGVGNPSESGCHLLYFFRQENGLPKTRFIHTHQVFERKKISRFRMLLSLLSKTTGRYAGTMSLRNPNIDRYVFIDDFCGSGDQARGYSKSIVEDIKSFDPNIKVSYFVLCGTSAGMETVRNDTLFDSVGSVFEMDESFECFSPSSRYFPSPRNPQIDASLAEHMCRHYGDQIFDDPLGYDDCQLLLAFSHNTPDNTLPVFWGDDADGEPWTPIFKRYPKLYS